ncbi:quercetin 2,3-dioxygenase [Termitidicoccus mucosus]|uniref:Quercetin 2,3-dioxygenase n=1 Tax=Termitidicoccus mucosus TaxID=1184151 RepID=A0A178IDZ8_9BACT|nr:quercetin 2,3-dioxygenase [Opitutaceae bacterium TSB47]
MRGPGALGAKRLVRVHRGFDAHWVGDGFPVRSVFDYEGLGQDELSPFLLMDYAGPALFPANNKRRGVGEHPHRGFETVTLGYQGSVAHRDSSGGGGVIGPGDVQWMTAASGVMHEEMHAEEFTRKGGVFEVVQLWVNLPAKDKMGRPRYQAITAADIPTVPLAGGAGTLRVIAGEAGGTRGPAKTFTPINLWDGHLRAGASARLEIPEGQTAAIFVRNGRLVFGGAEKEHAGQAELAVFTREGGVITLTAQIDADFVVLAGEPIDEPVYGHGPFVMNTEEEIRQAILDVRSGRFGRLSPTGT